MKILIILLLVSACSHRPTITEEEKKTVTYTKREQRDLCVAKYLNQVNTPTEARSLCKFVITGE